MTLFLEYILLYINFYYILLKDKYNLFMLQLRKFLLGDKMATVRVERACGCFRNSDYEQVTEFETIDEALEKANLMCTEMNEDFCHKHRFTASYEEGEVIIKMQMNG